MLRLVTVATWATHHRPAARLLRMMTARRQLGAILDTGQDRMQLGSWGTTQTYTEMEQRW